MKKRILKTMLLTGTLMTAGAFSAFANEPAVIYADGIEAPAAEAPAEEVAVDPVTVYVARDGAEVYGKPGDTEPVRYIALDTAISKVGEAEGFVKFTTDDSPEYIKAEDVKDTIIPPKTYSDEDLYILAHTICGEAHTCDDYEQQLVASVVMNRVASPKYPNTVEGVVFQKGQYACTRDGNYYRTPTERNWANAQFILENGSILPAGVLGQSGSRQGPVYVKTQRHYYCYM